jgi:hypothetical protein
MQTDEQFTQILSTALHDSTADLRYAGKVPAPTHLSLVVAPTALAGVAGIALAVAATTHGSHHRAVAGNIIYPPTPQPVATQTHPGRTNEQLAIRKLRLAGYTLRDVSGGTSGYYARVVDKVPSSATPADDDAAGVKAYVGVDPTTGLETAYVVSTSRIIAITSPNSSTVRLKVMLTGGSPQAVPLVGGN